MSKSFPLILPIRDPLLGQLVERFPGRCRSRYRGENEADFRCDKPEDHEAGKHFNRILDLEWETENNDQDCWYRWPKGI